MPDKIRSANLKNNFKKAFVNQLGLVWPSVCKEYIVGFFVPSIFKFKSKKEGFKLNIV